MVTVVPLSEADVIALAVPAQVEGRPVVQSQVSPAAGAGFTIDTVQFGATDTSDYAIVTGLTDTPDLGQQYVPSGDIATALGLASVPAGKLTATWLWARPITAVNKTATGPVKFTNTSPAGCDTTITMPSKSATNGPNTCSVSLSPASPAAFISEGDTQSALAATINCTCNGTTLERSNRRH